MSAIDDYLSRVKRLPPAPRILPELLQLLRRPDVDADMVVNLIKYDPALTASVLQLANSAFFGSARPAENLTEAVTRLGFQQVYILVAAVSGARNLSPAQKGYGMASGDLWRHSATSAVAAQLIARDLGDDVDVVFTAALLHDIGKIILSETLESVYSHIVQETARNQYSLLEVERRVLGFNHEEVGELLLARWNFPPNLVAAVGHHHHPEQAGEHARLAAYAHLGNLVAYALGQGYGNNAYALEPSPAAFRILGLTEDTLPDYMIRTFDQMGVIEALFRVSEKVGK